MNRNELELLTGSVRLLFSKLTMQESNLWPASVFFCCIYKITFKYLFYSSEDSIDDIDKLNFLHRYFALNKTEVDCWHQFEKSTHVCYNNSSTMKFKYYYHLLNWIDDTLSWKGEGKTHNLAERKRYTRDMYWTELIWLLLHVWCMNCP